MYTLHLNEKPVCIDVKKADSYLSRLRGWMFKRNIEHTDALWIEPCNSIHTFFMNFKIDAVFLNKSGTVVRVCENIFPRTARFYFDAKTVVEFHDGMVAKFNIRIGDQLSLKDIQREVI